MNTMAVEPKKLYNPLISKILKVDVLTETEKRFEIMLLLHQQENLLLN